jgi:hypothetical protein
VGYPACEGLCWGSGGWCHFGGGRVGRELSVGMLRLNSEDCVALWGCAEKRTSRERVWRDRTREEDGFEARIGNRGGGRKTGPYTDE